MGGLEGNRALITNYARFYSTGNTVEWVADLPWNRWPEWRGIRIQ